MSTPVSEKPPLTVGDVFHAWLPLSASWLFMAAELPLLSAVIARLADPEIHLAAYGGVVFPMALVIESPVIMLLAASTALCKDRDSYLKIKKFMMWAGGLLTLLHVVVAFTPAYYFVARVLIKAPDEIVAPARVGLMLMTPWTWAIAHRRFHQGVLIRFGHAGIVGWGTLVRLLSGASVLGTGYALKTIPGIMVATAAVSTGVLAEAGFVYARVVPILKTKLGRNKPLKHPLTKAAFLRFYLPLAATPFFELLAQPINASALSRMPLSLESLAVWPAIAGLNFMLRSQGIAFNEVVVALIHRKGGPAALRTFTLRLSGILWLIMLLLIVTPAGRFWFGGLAGLKPELAQYASKALWVALLIPGLSVWLSWFQGQLVHAHKTRAVTESVIVFLGVSGALLMLAVISGNIAGLYAGLAALSAASLCQTLWQFRRCRQINRKKATR